MSQRLDDSANTPGTPAGFEAAREAAKRLRRFGGERLVRDMSAIFVEDVPVRLAVARDGVGSGDPRTVEHAAHSMKSSCGQFGAAAMQRLCADAERLARQGELDDLPPVLDALEEEFSRFRAWLERAADDAPGGGPPGP